MKIFWNKDNLWNKTKNIKILYDNKIKIPESTIIEKNQIKNCNLSFLKIHKQYILRPSFLNEDNSKSSLAWYYKSIFPLTKNEIVEILKSNNYIKLFNWKVENLKSIIIQEFIETNIYWVYFTRNPNNIFEKWFYEISNNNDWITSWKKIWNNKLNSLQVKELELLWNNLEKIFSYPQDIEFCIKNNNIIILQTRNITTGNYLNYNFKKIIKLNWIYETLDFDELWEKQDYFSYKILKKLFNCIYIDWKIYFKKSLFNIFLFKSSEILNNSNLINFYKNYSKYLKYKILFNIIKIISFQKLDKIVLKDFFKNYYYSFLLDKKSNLIIRFDYNTNFITKFFLKIEKIKNTSFDYLEKYKKEYIEENYIWEKIYNFENKIFFYKWIIIKSSSKINNYIYKWKIKWIITDLKNFDKNKKNQVLIIENLDFNIYDKLENLSWIIIKHWNLLSHNSIVLREYKISSIINYESFDRLKVWEEIII